MVRLLVKCEEDKLEFTCLFPSEILISELVTFVSDMRVTICECKRMASRLIEDSANESANSQPSTKTRLEAGMSALVALDKVLTSECLQVIRSGLQSLGVDFELPVSPVGTPVLWWNGKEMKGSLGDYTKSDKTKLIVWLRNVDSGPPPRGVDSVTYNQMLEFYHKRQSELEKLDKDNDDFYLDSKWTDPCALKHSLTGVSTPRFKL